MKFNEIPCTSYKKTPFHADSAHYLLHLPVKKMVKLNLTYDLREEKDMREVKPLQKRIGQIDYSAINVKTVISKN